MHIQRAVLAGIVLWVLIFFEVSILMFGFGLEGTTYYMIHYILAGILILAVSWYYFKGPKSNKILKEGLLLGAVMVVIGIILDAIITVPLFIQEGYDFFLRLDIVMGLVLVVIVATVFTVVKK